jgi:hypothetical protein
VRGLQRAFQEGSIHFQTPTEGDAEKFSRTADMAFPGEDYQGQLVGFEWERNDKRETKATQGAMELVGKVVDYLVEKYTSGKMVTDLNGMKDEENQPVHNFVPSAALSNLINYIAIDE